MPFFARKNKKSPAASLHREEDAMGRGLEAIYLDAKGRVPDLARLERVSRYGVGQVLGACAGIGVCIAGIILIAHYVMRPSVLQDAQALSLALNGPEQVLLGQEQTYELEWRNTRDTAVQDVKMRLNLPLDFTVTGLEPAPSDPHLRLWTIGTVLPNRLGRIRIRGFFIGALGADTALQGLVTYREEKNARSSEDTVVRTVRATGSVLAGNILFSPRVTAGEPTSVRYVVANLGKQVVEGLLMRLTFPVGFIPASASTSGQIDVTNHVALFSIGKLLPNTFHTISLSGVFPSGAKGDALFKGETGRWGIDETFLPAARSESRVVIAPNDLTIHLVANGTDTARSMEPQEPVRITFDYQNISSEPVHDMEIRVEAESMINEKSTTGTSLLGWAQLYDPSQGVSTTKTRVQTIQYDKSRLPDLAEVPVDGHGSIEIGWPSLLSATGTRDARIRLTAQVRAVFVGEKTPRVLRTFPIVLTYRTDANISVEPRYFSEEGVPMGSGPLPPVVGTSTIYRIFWHIHKTLHGLRGIKVSAALPKTVAWAHNTQAATSTIQYDESTRVVDWSVESLPEGVNDLEGWFDIALTPEAVDVGRFATLLGETSFQFQDALLGENVARTKPSLSTDLSQDEGAKRKGVVRKE